MKHVWHMKRFIDKSNGILTAFQPSETSLNRFVHRTDKFGGEYFLRAEIVSSD